MVLDIEFIVADARPLKGRENQIVSFLENLHKKNETIKCTYINDNSHRLHNNNETKKYEYYYRLIGQLNTWKQSTRTYFDAHNAIKIDSFNKHKIPFNLKDPNSAKIFRKDHIRRYFSSESYGTVNRLRIGLKFDLLPRNGSNIDKRTEFELLKFIFNTKVRVNRGKDNIRIYDLGNWLRGIVSKSVIMKKKSFIQSVFSYFTSGFPKNPLEFTKSVGIIAILEYNNNEINSLPDETEKVESNNSYEIYSYDLRLKEIANVARIYFIKRLDTCDKTILHKLKSKLFFVNSNLLCLEYVINNIHSYNKKMDYYMNSLKIAEKNIIESNFTFLQSEPVIDKSKIAEIKKRINFLKNSTVITGIIGG